MKQSGKKQQVNLTMLSNETWIRIDKMVADGIFNSRSHFFRTAAESQLTLMDMERGSFHIEGRETKAKIVFNPKVQL